MKILLCAGTRPNFVKIAPLYHAAIKRGIDVRILHTGQHYDHNLNGVFFKQLGIKEPDINLGVSGGKRKGLISKIAECVRDYLKDNPVDFVIIVGDVNSTLGCAIGGNKAAIPVVHVEAGLRSHDKRMPEDANRYEVDRLADYHFISEPDGIQNMKIEKLYSTKSCFYVGNVMIDSLINNLEKINDSTIVDDLLLTNKAYCLVTLHRPSNVDEKLRLHRILKFLHNLAEHIDVVFPMHPRTENFIVKHGYEKLLSGIRVVPAQGYFEFLSLEKNAKFVITDSGGAQEETTYFGVPCITMRANTERPVTLLKGTSVLAGEDIRLAKYYSKLALEGRLQKKGKVKYWDGNAAIRILDKLENLMH